MPDSDSILEKLRKEGFRLTSTRKAILSLFLSGAGPMTAPELQARLKSEGVDVNKTTVYRELDFLMAQKITREVQLGDGLRRYEYFGDGHHHHLVCVRCKNIECFEMTACLKEIEAEISERKKFTFIKHSLEFFGICSYCSGAEGKVP